MGQWVRVVDPSFYGRPRNPPGLHEWFRKDETPVGTMRIRNARTRIGEDKDCHVVQGGRRDSHATHRVTDMKNVPCRVLGAACIIRLMEI